MKSLSILLPDYFNEMIAYPGQARFLALYYMGSKATWNDGWASASFSFYAAYSPLIHHPAVRRHLFTVNLGSDDGPPDHALVWDRQTRELAVADFDDAIKHVREQHEGRRPTPEEVEAYYGLLLPQRPTAADFRRLGMFEFMIGQGERQRELVAQLTEHLNQFLPPEIKGQVM